MKMNYLFTGLFAMISILCLMPYDGKADEADRAYELEKLKLASAEPYRKIGDQVYNLRPLSEYLIKIRKMTYEEMESFKPVRPIPSWKYLSAKVIQITQHDGLLLSLISPFESDRGKLVRLKNYSRESALIDGAEVNFFAVNDGTFSYVSVTGAGSKIESYNYGTVLTTKEFTDYIATLRPTAPKTNTPASKL